MSVLTDAVEARYNSRDIIALTNAGEALSSDTINQARFDAAAEDVIGAFLTYGALTFDENDAQHIETAVEGVIARLKMFAKAGDADLRAQYDQFVEKVVELSKYSTRARIQPGSSSPSKDQLTSPLDRTRFRDYVPDPPPRRVLLDD